MTSTIKPEGPSVTPPRYVVDLSLAPEVRYQELAREYAPHLKSLTSLFNDLLRTGQIPNIVLPAINQVCRLLMRRLYDDEQTREIRGISKEINVPMYLMVAFNVILDMLMGCTSGAVLSRENHQPHKPARMLHFRTLDWVMDPLRKVVVQLDYVRSESNYPTQIIASSITYAGFVGVLTGVRPGLSMSLNMRGEHHATKKRDHISFYLNQFLVLVGHRPSIASILRSYLLEGFKKDDSQATDADKACADFIARRTTAAYVILSDGNQTTAIEKDYLGGSVQTSRTFIARTNHDVGEHQGSQVSTAAAFTDQGVPAGHASDLEDLFDDSQDRLACIREKWEDRVASMKRRARRAGNRYFREHNAYVTKDKLIDWITTYSTTNELTHFAAIMDPRVGTVVWCEAYPEPLEVPEEEEEEVAAREEGDGEWRER